jgi:hypothetical protein
LFVVVFVDQSAEDRSCADAVVGQGRRCRRWYGRVVLEGSVWPVFVVVRGVGVEHRGEVSLVVDQEPVGAFAPYGADPSLGVGVGPHRQLHPIQTIGTDVCG